MSVNSRSYRVLKSKIRRTLKASPGLWEEIVAHSEEIDLGRGIALEDHFETSKCIYVVVKGSFECSIERKQQANSLVWFFFDDMFDVIVGMNGQNIIVKTEYNIIAMEPSTVIKLETDKIGSWRKNYQAFETFCQSEMLRWFFNYFEIRNNLSALSTVEFIDYLETHYPSISKRIPSHKLARFMGITPEWLSKLKNRKPLEPIE
ncbi:MAG: hypothetical protein AAGD88_10515 [Bacteroidota bacterium]